MPLHTSTRGDDMGDGVVYAPATVAITGHALKVSIPALEIVYDGKLDPGSGLVSGNWAPATGAARGVMLSVNAYQPLPAGR